MAKTIIVFLALFIFVAHCHVLRLKDTESGRSKKLEHEREKRSCFVGDNNDNGPPPIAPMLQPGYPPPPPFFQKWNRGKGADFSQQRTISEASLSADSGTGRQSSDNYGDQSAGYSSGDQNGAGFKGRNFDESGNIKEKRNSFQTGYNSQFGRRGSRGFAGQQQTKSGEFGAEVANKGSFSGSKSGSASSAQAYGSGSSGNEQQSASSGFGHGHGHGHSAARYQHGSFGSGQWQSEAEVSGGNGAGADASREALKGALNLASQGAEMQQAGSCSSCGKSNYAISNAKSDSGDAIAVSVGR